MKNQHYLAALAAFDALRQTTPQSVADEQHVLDLLDSAIDQGFADAYPMKALLSASNDWQSLVIVRPTQFQILLWQGVEAGCLGPDGHDEAWAWLEAAALHNDPAQFLDDDMERYFDILMTAVEHGNDIAHDIMDAIWEPENLIDDD